MSLNGEFGRKMGIEENANIYHNNAVTPSLMSSHSNKRQNHHLGLFNPPQQVII
jgi:hypothetical protein